MTRRARFNVWIEIFATIALMLTFSTTTIARERIVFGGGPAGGTFQIAANSIQTYKPIKKLKDYKVRAQSSAGSIENLRKVDAGRSDMGVVYSGHVYQGLHGMLKNDPNKYEDVRAVAFLYGAPAQLVVRAGSGITSARQLEGKKVGVGNAGSGAFANCELFFSHLGLWEKIERNAMGYNDAAAAFGNNQLDAFWLFTAFPSGAVIQAAQMNDIALVGIQKDAEDSGFFEKYPYFSKLAIPAGTYKGVDTNTPSFEDSTLWVANKKVSADAVYQMLSVLFTPEGLKYMAAQKKTFKAMAVEKGLNGVVTPIHPGAEKFWKEKGVMNK